MENHLFRIVMIAIEGSKLDMIPLLCELGSDSLRLRVYNWLFESHPEIFEHFPMRAELEEFLLHHNHFVSFLSFTHI